MRRNKPVPTLTLSPLDGPQVLIAPGAKAHVVPISRTVLNASANSQATREETDIPIQNDIADPADIASETEIEETAPPVLKGDYTLLTLIFLCVGLGILICGILVPQAEENSRLEYDCGRLKVELANLEKQVERNDQLIHNLSDNPALMERLAQNQMHYIRAGAQSMGNDEKPEESSPLAIAALPPPPPTPEYQPPAGRLATLFRNDATRRLLMGGGMLLAAIGLVLGAGPLKH